MSRALIGGLLVALLSPLVVPGSVSDASADPLAPLARLVGGAWHTEGSYQVFEWAVGRRGVRARSYVPGEEEDVLVSEGLWFWHPGEQAIRGAFVATGMGIDLFDYLSVRVDDDALECELQTFGDAFAGSWVETWEFSDDDHYVWTLGEGGPDGPRTIMSAEYERRRE